jgi:hypothetical protein
LRSGFAARSSSDWTSTSIAGPGSFFRTYHDFALNVARSGAEQVAASRQPAHSCAAPRSVFACTVN